MPITCRKCRSANAEVYIPYARLSLCPKCFLDFYVRRVKRTIEDFSMFTEDLTVGVAISGGKDSAALLHALHHAYPNLRLVALHVNLGIPKYSAHCQGKVEELAKMLDVELHVFNLYKELKIRISDFEKTIFKKKICSACGTIKRHIFEELARKTKVDVLATGHNLDDVAGIMFNNFLYGHWDQLIRLKPVLPPLMEGFAVKVKPLIRISENENLLYCLYADVSFREIGCPYSKGTSAKKRTKDFNNLSKNNPYFRHQVLNRFLELIPMLENILPKTVLVKCQVCGFPSSGSICAFCKRVLLVKNTIDNDLVV